MDGQWLGKIDVNGITGSIRVDLEDRGDFFFGHAYIFYEEDLQRPGFRYSLRIPKSSPHKINTDTWFLGSAGGEMSSAERKSAEAILREKYGNTVPDRLNVEFSITDRKLRIDWQATDNNIGTELLVRSDIAAKSQLLGRQDLTTWDQFREWAVDQQPRQYIFRGQASPNKLASSFHRTWRKDLKTWVAQDVPALFGAVIERVNYPLQLGQLAHNGAIWSILQHHGYPTPMLDWTFSPFVAAFFAFQNVKSEDEEAPRIYILDQSAWTAKYGRNAFIVDDAPLQLVVLESLSIGNPRSGPQQALSTVTNLADVEAFIREREELDGQTYLTVCDLPANDRNRIMRELELMGITYGSLFPGMDGVCRDIRDRLFAAPS
jgi:hypothetical protein